VVALVERWTRDRKVAGSTPGRGAIKSTRPTQPSISPGWVNRVLACVAAVKVGVLFIKQYNLVPCEGFHVNAPICGS